MTALNLIRFLTVLSTAVSMSSGLAHLLSLPHKMRLGHDDYLTVQQIYRGWAFVGIALLAALVGNGVLTFVARHRPGEFSLLLLATVCILVSLVVFFAFIFPGNQATNNWTTLPANWETLRRRWEYGHAVDATLYLVALGALTAALLVGRGRA
jgi:hypothetical protein